MFGGIKSLIKDTQSAMKAVPQPVAQEPLNLGASKGSGFGLSNIANIREKADTARAARDAAAAAAPVTPITPVTATPTAPVVPAPVAQTLPTDQSKINYLSAITAPEDYTRDYGTLKSSGQKDVDKILARFEAGTATPNDEMRLIQLGKKAGVDFFDAYRPAAAVPIYDTAGTTTDVNQVLGLTRSQEETLADLSQAYSAGETLKNKQITKLEELLGAGGLGNIESYFGTPTYVAPAGYENFFNTGEINQDTNIGDIITSFDSFLDKGDTVAATQYARSLGLDPTEIETLLSGYGTQKFYNRPTYTKAQLEEVFSTGETGLQDRINTIFASTLGTDEDVTELTDYFNDKYNLDLTVQDVKDMYNADVLQEKSIAEIEDFLQTSSFNKLQEAGRFGGILQNVFEYGGEDISSILRDVMATGESQYDPELRNIYNEFLRSEDITPDFQDRILSTAARITPNSSFWQNQYDDTGKLVHNGEMLFTAYSNPIPDEGIVQRWTNPDTGKERSGTGQYGFYNGAPILNADVVNKALGDKNTIGHKRFYGKNVDLANTLGWDFASAEEYAQVKRGVDAVGLNSRVLNERNLNNYQSVLDKAKEFGNKSYTDPETGMMYYLVGRGEPDAEGNVTGKYEAVDPALVAEINKLEDKANQLGIDPSQYDSAASLFDAVETATQDLYFVVGQFNGRSQFRDQAANDPNSKGKNHAAVYYKEINGKLIPINEPSYFKYYKPKDSLFTKVLGDSVGGFFDGLLRTVPAEIILLTPAAPYYPIAKGMQAAAMPGADLGDVLKAGGLAYLKQTFIPKEVAPKIAGGIADLPGMADLSAGMQEFITNTGTNAIIAAGVAGLTNQDVGDALLSSLSVSAIKGLGNETLAALESSPVGDTFAEYRDEFTKAVEKLVNTDGEEQFSFKNIDPRFKDLVTNIFVDTMFGKDFDDALQSGILRMAMTEAKWKAKTKGAVEKTKTLYEV